MSRPAKKRATPSQLARARRDPAVGLPPAQPRDRTDWATLLISVGGATLVIGPRLTADGTDLELTKDGTSVLTLVLTDPDGAVAEILTDEAALLEDGARVNVDGVIYVMQSAEGSEERTVTLVLEDEVSWRLRHFSRYLSVSRAKATRAEFVLRLVEEAARAPRLPLAAYIPELTDPQAITKPTMEAA